MKTKNSSNYIWRLHVCGVIAFALALAAAKGQSMSVEDLPRLSAGKVKAANALWIENPLTAQFKTSKRVVVADLKGPAVITMIHFAYGSSQVSSAHKRLDRDLLLQMYWDDEKSPSVEVPLVDFFCDPAGMHDELSTALVNVRRGFNAYFPMPFRKSARIELVYEGSLEPGDELWRLMPCYSYVIFRTEKKVPRDAAYFHSAWRQETLLLGKQDYVALEAKGQGKLIGWNVTVRQPGRGYPVDENAKFFVDGETNASVELQGLEDSFGFSWGFPETENLFPLTGYFPFYKGAAAYRFFVPDAINFQKSLRVAIGFGENENPKFRRQFSKPGNALQLSTTVYWYQREPHASFPPMLSAAERAPAPEEAFWPAQEKLPSTEELRSRGVKLRMHCGRPGQEVIFAERGFAAKAKKGFAWKGWPPPIYFARAGNDEVEVELTVPQGESGLVRVYVIDPDEFEGGRKQSVSVAGESLGTIEKFSDGRWLEQRVNPAQTATGRILVRAQNERKGSNAVISIIEWVKGKK